jgi:AcrR family transcriptional regulator
MGRPKKFDRDDLLDKVALVFWENGFEGTTLRDLEQATGVNKSGLYSEFKNKEDLYLASLDRYISNLVATSPLSDDPPGWDNIERFLKRRPSCSERVKGCFCVNTVRELPILSREVNEMVTKTFAGVKLALIKNIAAERSKMDPEPLAEMVLTYFLGLHIEQNLATTAKHSDRKTRNFMRAIRAL